MTKELAQKHDAIFVKAEPMQDDVARQLVSLGFRKSSKSIQPQKTVLLDLTKSEDDLLSAMHHKTRYNIRVAERHGIVVRKIQNPNDKIQSDVFWNLMRKTTDRDKFSSYPKAYYEKLMQLCELYVAEYQGTAVAAAMILQHENTAYYLHGASDYEHRALMAPYALHWEIVKMLHAAGYMIYDLWGIDALRWPGVTRFKLGWGGRTIEYPGAFDLVISHPWYAAYSLAQKLRV